MEYKKSKMKQLAETDPYLKFMFNDLFKRGHSEDEALQVLYNSEVDNGGLGDYRHVYNTMEEG